MPTTDSLLANTQVRPGYNTPKLYNWLKKATASPSTVKIAWCGDSTSDLAGNASSILSLILPHTAAGGLLEGFDSVNNMQNFGANGNTLTGFLNNTPTGFGIDSLITYAPDLIIFSYGINDVRQNQMTAAQLTAALVRAINKIRAALPLTDMVLRMPNNFMSVSPHSYIQQGSYADIATAAQAQTDILYNGWLGVKDIADNVVFWNAQEQVFGRTARAVDNNHTDEIHPQYTYIVNGIVPLIAFNNKPFSPALSADALTQSYTTPWTIYSRALEDTTHYVKITQGILNAATTAGSFMDIKYPNQDAKKCPLIRPGDIINIGNTNFIKLPNGVTRSFISAGDMRINSSAITSDSRTNAVVTVYRSIFNHTQACEDYVNQRDAYPYWRKVVINNSGANFFDISTAQDDNGITTPAYVYTPFKTPSAYSLSTSDVIIVDGQAPLTLTGATFSAQGNALRVTLAGTWTQYVGLTAYIFGNHDHE